MVSLLRWMLAVLLHLVIESSALPQAHMFMSGALWPPFRLHSPPYWPLSCCRPRPRSSLASRWLSMSAPSDPPTRRVGRAPALSFPCALGCLRDCWPGSGDNKPRGVRCHPLAQKWPQYAPCECQGACKADCPCAGDANFCEKFCGCNPAKCGNRFAGCTCKCGNTVRTAHGLGSMKTVQMPRLPSCPHTGCFVSAANCHALQLGRRCTSKQCPCLAAGRECDPDLCKASLC